MVHSSYASLVSMGRARLPEGFGPVKESVHIDVCSPVHPR
ncbi:hypothetical protein ACP4OV_005157 [Aristida adscensionis]